MPIVYLITNTVNDKAYVGMTSRTLEARWRAHLSCARNNSPFRFHSAIRKYGEDAWTFDILEDSEDLDYIRKQEEAYITALNTTSKERGYNAKPGGCGGWIVKPENYEKWLANHADVKGKANPNVLDISNDDLVHLALSFYQEYSYIPGHGKLIDYGKTKGLKVPKSFTNYRFQGKYINLARIVEGLTGATYNPYYRSEEQKAKLSEANSKIFWWSNDTLRTSIRGSNPPSIKEGETAWYRGRKYGPKN